MSSKKGSQDNITTKEAVSSPKSSLEEQHQSVDEAKDVPRKTKVINDYPPS